jgi:cytochrome P450
MASMPAPVVEFPLPKSPVPFEPAPELLALSRQSPVLRTVLPGDQTAWLITGFEQVREVLVDPRFSRAPVSSPGREKRGLEYVTASGLMGMDPPEHTRLRKLVAAKRARPADDLLSVLIAARDNEDRLSEEELPSRGGRCRGWRESGPRRARSPGWTARRRWTPGRTG